MQTTTVSYPSQIMVVVVDLLGLLPESKNRNCYVMVVGNYFSHWMEGLPIPNQEEQRSW